MSSPSEESTKRSFVGCRYSFGTDNGEVARCTMKKGVIKLYRPGESAPFFTFHKDGMWWRSGDTMTVFKRGADELYLHGIRQ